MAGGYRLLFDMHKWRAWAAVVREPTRILFNLGKESRKTSTHRMIVAVDWDDTVTAKDSLSIVAQSAYVHKPEFVPKWDYFVDSYLKDYDRYVQDGGNARKSLQEERQFLSGLISVEEASVRRVEESGLFSGVPLDTVLSQAKDVQVKPKWWDLYDKLVQRKVPVAIVSINWSAELIREVFRLSGRDPTAVEVRANQLSVVDGICTGRLSEGRERLRTADDKERIIKEFADRYGKVVYVGDSSTDTLALAESEVGIVMRNKALYEKLQRFGVSVQIIDDWHEFTTLQGIDVN
uniref:ARAD1B21956p n=1 Tax=Blastobotrys adeninivorans TaxID=409370 RepID=A0A060T7R5_BLAAD